MGQTKRISQLECATAQAILEHLEITAIRPPRLGEILQVTDKRAGSILKRLGWRREPIKNKALWYKDGMDKIFANNLGKRIRFKAKRLGVILS